jgi:hypothetical protein
VTKNQYKKRLKLFLDHIGLPGADLDEQGQSFLDQARQDPEWANEQIQNFLYNSGT